MSTQCDTVHTIIIVLHLKKKSPKPFLMTLAFIIIKVASAQDSSLSSQLNGHLLCISAGAVAHVK